MACGKRRKDFESEKVATNINGTQLISESSIGCQLRQFRTLIRLQLNAIRATKKIEKKKCGWRPPLVRERQKRLVNSERWKKEDATGREERREGERKKCDNRAKYQIVDRKKVNKHLKLTRTTTKTTIESWFCKLSEEKQANDSAGD